MNKKLILKVVALAMLSCGLNFQNTRALAADGLITRYSDGRCAVEGDIGIPCPEECFNDAGEFQVCYLNEDTTVTVLTDEEAENMLEEGTSGEPEVVCADANEPDCNKNNPALTGENKPEEDKAADADEDTETNEDAPLWPAILSFSALGVAAVLIIIINLASRKRK